MVDEDLIIISESPIDSPLPAKIMIHPQIVSNWSGVIKSVLKDVETDIVLLANVDFFCLKSIDAKKLKILIDYMMTDPNILQGYVFNNPKLDRKTFLGQHRFVKNFKGLRIVKCKHWQDCSIEDGGIVMPLFKRNLIIDLLRPKLSIQDAEQNLIQDVHKTDLYGVTTDPQLFSMMELHTSSSGSFWHLEFLDRQDQKLIKQYQPENVMFESNPYATHISVLIEIGKSLNIRRVLEFGCGFYSTLTFLDKDIFPELEFLHSVENDKIWSDKITHLVNDNRFQLTTIKGEIKNIIDNNFVSGYDLIFIDDSTGILERARTIEAISNCDEISGVVVIHDYEQETYQKAARTFEHSIVFDCIVPNTGILWNDNTTADVEKLGALDL